MPVQEDFGLFWRDLEWMGLQRHLKVLGIFAHLSHRDGKDGYLKDLPLVWRYAPMNDALLGADAAGAACSSSSATSRPKTATPSDVPAAARTPW